MKLELKNVKVYSEMSEETICFSATLWVDGKKFAECKNEGHGGMTDIDFVKDPEPIMEELEEHCRKELAECPELCNISDYWGLEYVIYNLLDEYQAIKFVQKKQKKGLVLHDNKSNDKPYVAHSFLNLHQPLINFFKTGDGRAFLKNSIVKMKKNGFTILNTNIPEEFLKEEES